MKLLVKEFIYKYIMKYIYYILRNVVTANKKMIRNYKFKGNIKVKTHDKKKFYLYNNSFILESSIFWLGLENISWENMTRKIWINLTKKSEIIIDIGANTGFFSIIAKVYNDDCNVYAFEPQPNIFNILKKNVQINNFNISCNKVAISNYVGDALFYNYGDDTFTEKNTTAGSLNKNWRQENQSTITVPVITLKQFIELNNFINIDLMKIDVETFEYEVLLGMGKYIEIFNPIIILEIQTEMIGNKILSLFNKLNYSYFNINEKIGLIQKKIVEIDENNLNYLFCPNTKNEQIEMFIIK